MLLMLLAWQGVGRAAVVLEEGQSSRVITADMQYLSDETGRLGLADVVRLPGSAWQQNDSDSFSHGYTKANWWLRFTVGNASGQTSRLLVELAYPVLDDVEVWVLGSDQTLKAHYRLGDKQLFHSRPLQHRFFLVPLELPPAGEHTVVLRLKTTSSMQAPLTLWDERDYHEQDQRVLLAEGLFFGGMGLMVLYSIFVFIALRDRVYFYYVMFVFSMLGFLGSLKGLSFQFLWPRATEWNDRVLIVSLASLIAFGGLFTLRFLRIREFLPRLYRPTIGLVLLAGLTVVLAFFLGYGVLMQPLIIISALSCLVLLVVGAWRWHQGDRSARFYSIAWGSMLLGGVVLALNKFQLLPLNFLTENAMQMGVAAEVILLSLAIVDRINEDRRLRFQAQQDMLASERRANEAQYKALVAEREANELLEHRVHERTEALQIANRKLEELSTSDQLTGLRNRRYLDRALQEECCRCQRYQHPLAVLLLDIDHFKRFNDEFGHDVGDECLRRVGAVLAMEMRTPIDHVARYGGEEFCVVMPETELEGARVVAERIRAAVEAMSFMVGDRVVPVTVSVGVASMVPPDEDYSREILKKADVMLYEAKAAGRNCVMTPRRSGNRV